MSCASNLVSDGRTHETTICLGRERNDCGLLRKPRRLALLSRSHERSALRLKRARADPTYGPRRLVNTDQSSAWQPQSSVERETTLMCDHHISSCRMSRVDEKVGTLRHDH